MDKYVKNSFDKNYAAAWSADQGGFSYQLAQNLLAYLNKNNIGAKTCLDICSGTGEFLSYFAKAGFACAGTEIAQSMIDFSKEKYPNITFKIAKSVNDISIKGKFDVITCNHDVVNMQEKFSEWQDMFKNVYSSLSKGGVFMFDYYTKKKLENWNEVCFEESDTMDHVRNIKKGMDNKCVINEIYYIKNEQNLYQKTFDVLVEAYFENELIVDALKKAGFKDVSLLDFALEPIANAEERNRIHVIARK